MPLFYLALIYNLILMLKNLLVVSLTFLLLISCTASKPSKSDQGIQGKVLWIEGNQMPGPNKEADSGSPIIREIHIYPLIKLSDLQRVGSLFSAPDQSPVMVVTSNTSGEFKAQLEPGTYSIMTKEGNGFFANSFDGKNNIMPVRVEQETYTDVTITVNYKASY